MSSVNDARVKEVFGEAMEMPVAEREAFLERMCGGNKQLREAVASLLSAVEGEPDFLSGRTLKTGVLEAVLGEGAGSRIGPYKLLQLIGEGGFGSVFMAEQERPVRRRVALKIIKLGMDTRAVVARFEQERQALAMMDHPHIAKVLDAGATEAGRPYFVMELVKGDPITAYCDKNNLVIRERLELFVQVCQAVQHAHTKGVIHRDIKPTNILVATQDGRPMARVIDFGIAKATDHRLTEKTVFTEFRQLIGTPEYMSPEQAEGGLDIDTRTDVYSLGVLLYELLTGTTPFDAVKLRSAAFAEMQRIIREVEPPKPSTRLSKSAETLSSIAAHRRIEPARLGAIMRGELDWIAMKALDKDRSRRYETASGLAGDVQRYLTGDSVGAAPPSTPYRIRKFVRRHKASAVAAGLIGAALVLGVIGTSVGLIKAQGQRDRAIEAERLATERLSQAEKAKADADKAREEAERFNRIATAVSDFFTLDVLNLQPTPAGQPELTVREVLDRIPEKIGQHFAKEPSVEGIIRERVGQLYLNMGKPLRAAEFLERGAALLEKGLGAENRRTMMARQRLGELLMELERYAEAEIEFDRVYSMRLKVLGAENQFTLNSMMRRGAARVSGGRIEEGMRDVEHCVAEFVRLHGPTSRSALMAKRELVEDLRCAGRGAESEIVARAALDDIHRVADLAPAEADFRAALGETLVGLEKWREAVEELEAARALNQAKLPPTHPDQIRIRWQRARALVGLNRLDEAAAEFEAVYQNFAPLYGEGAPRCRELARALADLAFRRGDTEAQAKWRAKG